MAGGFGLAVGCLAGSFSFAKQAKMRKSLNGIRGPFVGMNPRVLKKLSFTEAEETPDTTTTRETTLVIQLTQQQALTATEHRKGRANQANK